MNSRVKIRGAGLGLGIDRHTHILAAWKSILLFESIWFQQINNWGTRGQFHLAHRADQSHPERKPLRIYFPNAVDAFSLTLFPLGFPPLPKGSSWQMKEYEAIWEKWHLRLQDPIGQDGNRAALKGKHLPSTGYDTVSLASKFCLTGKSGNQLPQTQCFSLAGSTCSQRPWCYGVAVFQVMSPTRGASW